MTGANPSRKQNRRINKLMVGARQRDKKHPCSFSKKTFDCLAKETMQALKYSTQTNQPMLTAFDVVAASSSHATQRSAHNQRNLGVQAFNTLNRR